MRGHLLADQLVQGVPEALDALVDLVVDLGGGEVVYQDLVGIVVELLGCELEVHFFNDVFKVLVDADDDLDRVEAALCLIAVEFGMAAVVEVPEESDVLCVNDDAVDVERAELAGHVAAHANFTLDLPAEDFDKQGENKLGVRGLNVLDAQETLDAELLGELQGGLDALHGGEAAGLGDINVGLH